MRLSEADVLRLGELSRIEITPEILPELQRDLNGILEFAAVLAEVDPELPPYELDFGGNVLRSDTAAPSLSQDEALALAPASQDGFFRVPRTVDNGGHGS